MFFYEGEGLVCSLKVLGFRLWHNREKDPARDLEDGLETILGDEEQSLYEELQQDEEHYRKSQEEQAHGGQSVGEQTHGGQSGGEQTRGGRSVEEQAHGSQLLGERAGEQDANRKDSREEEDGTGPESDKKGPGIMGKIKGFPGRISQSIRHILEKLKFSFAKICDKLKGIREFVQEKKMWLEDENENLCDIAQPLLKWYDGHRRVLPWRENPAPYRVWVSEIMLQQTRVEAVKPYFERFMEALPGIPELAQAPEDKLLKLWEGLGYYNRARNLQKAAQAIMAKYGGRMPDSREELLKLPGIGSYTAGAVASIAYGRAVPAVDGNVLRVISRYRADGRDMLNDKVRKSVEEDLKAVMPKDRPGDFNQALMELGAVVCIPNGAPKCGECPWESSCKAHIEGRETEFPKKAAKKARSNKKKTILVIQDAMRAAIRKRPAKGMLAGMYEFPSEEGHLGQEEVLALLKEKGLHPLRIQKLPDSRHVFTHKEWDMIGYAVRVDELEPVG